MELKDKIKTVGVARQQLHFLCSDKENEAKESLALRWACLTRNGGDLNPDCSNRSRACASPAIDEALVSLYFCGGLHRSLCYQAFLLQVTLKGRPPVTGRLIKIGRYWIPQKTGKGDALRKEKALLHTFVAGQKYGVGRDATRRFCF